MHARARVMVAAAMLVATGSAAVAESKEPVPFAVPFNPKKKDVTVLKDAAGTIYVVVGPHSSDKQVFVGTEKVLYRQQLTTSSADGAGWTLSMWSPRLGEARDGFIERSKDGAYRKSCWGPDEAVLTEVTGVKATDILEKANFLSNYTVRRAHILARDDRGIYYYVDKLSPEHGGKGFRVFVGKKGALKQVPLVDIASDSRGEVFSTKTSQLRLVVDKDPSTGAATSRQMAWFKGDQKTPLVVIDPTWDTTLVWKDFDLYKKLGGICDNM